MFQRPAKKPISPPSIQALEPRTLFAVPAFDHVVVVIEENKSPAQVIGSPEAPYINSLAKNGAYLSNAHGTHRPSQPNYLALFAGSNFGVTTNDPVNLGAKPNLASQLISAGKSFNIYSEDLPSVGYTGASYASYARKHNPAVSFSNVPASSNRPYSDFPTDFTRLPTVSFVVPNLDDDSHDGTIDASDTWLKNHFAAYDTWAKTHNSLLIIAYDEGDLADATNHTITIFSGAKVTPGQYATSVNHYNTLRTIENIYALAPLASAASAAPIDYIFTPATAPLQAPINLAAKATSTTAITLTWTDVSTAETTYKIQRSTDGANFYALAGTGANATTYTNTGLTPGKKYYYRLYAANASAGSPYSAIVSAITPTTTPPTPPPVTPPPPGTLPAPTNFSARASTSVANAIDLFWTDNATNESAYKIERSTDGVTFYALAATGPSATFYRNTALTKGKKYYYRIYAINSTSRSPYSTTVSVVL